MNALRCNLDRARWLLVRLAAMASLCLTMANTKAETECHSVHPFWSPFDNRIVFFRMCGEHQDVWLVRSDGHDAVQLTHDGKSYLPVWGRNADEVVFRRKNGNTDRLILLGLDTGSERVLASGLDAGLIGAIGVSIPLNSAIVATRVDEQDVILAIDLDSNSRSMLLDGVALRGNVATAGGTVLFDYQGDRKGGIGVIKPDGWAPLFEIEDDAFYPQATSGLEKLAYVRMVNENPDAYVYHTSLGEHCMLHASIGFDGEASFAPDQENLVLISTQSGQAELMTSSGCDSTARLLMPDHQSGGLKTYPSSKRSR
ncbi:MAG: hypothetical protein R3212_01640 [Xanthomonadales bacterium]|nr:hypothetical protein [Xanthomonadales bacterium]